MKEPKILIITKKKYINSEYYFLKILILKNMNINIIYPLC